MTDNERCTCATDGAPFPGADVQPQQQPVTPSCCTIAGKTTLKGGGVNEPVIAPGACLCLIHCREDSPGAWPCLRMQSEI